MIVGDTVGSYRIVGTLGEGGMGSVFLAEHSLIGRHAAIKVLHPHLSEKQEQVNRFFNEARATSKIKHPSILEIFDFGWNDSGQAYIVMEYLEGESLEDRANRLGRLGVEHALHITRQVAGALSAAHAQEVIHRDLKPDNIFVVRDPEVAGGERIKILDFGIAKVLSDTSNTKDGALIGTPDYMAPEQCRGSAYTDFRSDFYSLGCILFRLLCGRPPFVGDGIGEVLAAHIHVDVPRPRAVEPSIPPQLESFILRLLAKNPDERFENASELIAELDTVWRGISPIASATGISSDDHRPMGKARQTQNGPSTISSAAMELPAGATATSGSKLAVMLSAVLVLMVGGIGFAFYGFPWGTADGEGEEVAAAAPATAGRGASAPGERGDPSAEADRQLAPQPEQVRIDIRSQPEGADVFRASDGLRVGKTPYRYSLDPVGGELVYIVKMEGYESQTVSFPADRSGEVDIELAKTGSRQGAGSSRSPSTASSRPDPFDTVVSGKKKNEADELLNKIRRESKGSGRKQRGRTRKNQSDKDKVFDPFQ